MPDYPHYSSRIQILDNAPAGNPPAGSIFVYSEAGKLKQKTSAGVVTDFTAGSDGDVATDPIWDAKGDLAVGTGADTAIRLAVGTNGHVLTADSAETSGVKWAAASGGGGGAVRQVVIAETDLEVATTTTVPLTTRPTASDGVEYMTASITPTDPDSILLVQFDGWMSNSGFSTPNYAIFRDAGDALVARGMTIRGNSEVHPAVCAISVSAESTSATTFRVRFGAQPSSGHTAYMLRTSATGNQGAARKATLTIWELQP